MTLSPYSLGIGDRFAHQARAQLDALLLARQAGVEVTPVWNKSFREHSIIGSQPGQTRQAAAAAVAAAGWQGAWFCDADHIGLKTVDFFLEACDFFTIDVADFIGQPAPPAEVAAFTRGFAPAMLEQVSRESGLVLAPADLETIAAKYLLAVQQAGEIWRHIQASKGGAPCIIEVSMDETDQAQSPVELFVILGGLAQQQIPLATIAPKFTGRFNKGVDYVGDLDRFAAEFEQDLQMLALAKKFFSLPVQLKLSVHSGSDKFSLYPLIHAALVRHQAGLHLKTAGTTWLEELIGLAEAGGDALGLVSEIYRRAHERFDELARPYATVIDIDPRRVPAPAELAAWSSEQMVRALRHDQACPDYNPDLRQLLHVSFRIAAEMGETWTRMLETHRAVIGRNVTENLFTRHIKPLFYGGN